VQVGLVVSLVVHVLAILAYTAARPIVPTGPLPSFVSPRSGEVGEGMRVIRLREVATQGARPDQPEEVRPTEAPSVRPGAPDLSDAVGPGIVGPGPTAAERLRPHLSDARIWAPLDAELNELTLEQRLELQLAGDIADWQDSLAIAAEAQRALTDWTKTDAQGRRWGVSEGKLHLGDITLPLPFSFGTPVGRRDEYLRRQWEWDEIQRGAATGLMRDSWKERARAIRERRDKERAATTKPDTSGVRR
jgi:hypothetical protein